MPIELVEIVNPNGRKGLVAPGSRAALEYTKPPAQRAKGPIDVAGPTDIKPPLEQPPGNASTEEWRAFATDPNNPAPLDLEAAGAMTRDELVAHFESQED